MNAVLPAPLAVTMGEPAGIGPELIARIWQNREKQPCPPFVLFGAKAALDAVAPNLPVAIIDDPREATDAWGKALPLVDIPLARPVTPSVLDPDNGAMVIAAIDQAVAATQAGHTKGVVTAPIHKANLYRAGFDAPGHTEYLARLCGLPDKHSVMMLAAKNLRVIPVTVHVPLKDVARTLRMETIVHAGMVAAHDLKTRFGIEAPRIAVAGLNPHAGEDGTIGMEEGTHITPALWALKDAGIDVVGPLPADTLFHEEARTAYDVVLCMYHDQALIPIKTLDFWGGVNVTLGLPFIRTSPDHGTALSLAGRGTARLDSMLAALNTAASMAHFEAVNTADDRGRQA